MKTIVIYYSAQNHTKKIAEKIATNLGADIFAITPKVPYVEADLDWMNENSRSSREFHDLSLRDVELESSDVPNWSEYDTVVLLYPIWWGIAAWPTNSFVKSVDWSNKTIFPCAVSHSSGVGESAALLKKDANGGVWQDASRLYQDAPDDEINAFLKSLNNF